MYFSYPLRCHRVNTQIFPYKSPSFAQWGFVSESNGQSDIHAFPITFDEVYSCVLIGKNMSVNAWIGDISKAGFNCGEGNDWLGDPSIKQIYYMAIGR